MPARAARGRRGPGPTTITTTTTTTTATRRTSTATRSPPTWSSCRFPSTPQAFTSCLASLPAEVLRAKGIVLLRDPPGEKRSFQKVETDVEISPCQLAEPEQHAPRAVFIGPRLPVEVDRGAPAGAARLTAVRPARSPAGRSRR